jgi:2-polyprenyl-6-methoxyphenol hydroxylase-like FAD-dependent oxidoreductase
MKGSDVIVVGAGIGGLAAALGLLRAGQRVRVFEQVAELGEVGAGLSITPNAGKSLVALGLGETLRRIGSRPPAGAIRHYATGEVLVTLAQDQTGERYGLPLYHVHRADLHEALAAAVRVLDPACLVTGNALVGLDSRADGVAARLRDGSVATADWLVGADGIHSATRVALFGPDRPNFTGYLAYRGLVPGERVPPHLLAPPLCMTVGPRRLLMRYPLRGGALVNIVAIAQRSAWTEEGWSVRATPAELLAEFADFEPHARELLELVPPPVGSSASSSTGSFASARAIATRWRMPPESCSGSLPRRPRGRARRAAPCARARASAGPAAEPPDRDQHVVERREFRQQEVELEDEAEPREAQRRELRRGERGGVAPFEQHAPRARPVEQAEQVEQRGLARARRAGDRDELPAPMVSEMSATSVTPSGRRPGDALCGDERRLAHAAPRTICTGSSRPRGVPG